MSPSEIRAETTPCIIITAKNLHGHKKSYKASLESTKIFTFDSVNCPLKY